MSRLWMFRQKEPEQSWYHSSSAPRKTSSMKRSSRVTSGRRSRFALLLLFPRCMNDRITWCGPGTKAFGLPWRFSSWLARPDRCTKLRQKGWHDPTYLSGSHRSTSGLPGQEGMPTTLASQRHLEERQDHDLTPTKKLLRSPHACGKPEPVLCEKAEEMFFREPQRVALWHLL